MAAAEALFREGRARLAVGNVAGACDKFAESQRLDPSSGTLINLAACHEKLGLLATAWGEYLAAGRLARTQRKPARVEEAERKAKELADRVSYLTILVPSAPPGLEIRRDEVILEEGSLGSPLPIDPGPHRIVVSAPGYEEETLEVTIGAESDLQQLTVPALVPVRVDVPIAEAVVPPAPPARPPAPPAPEHRVERRLVKDRTLGWVVGGAGVAFAAAGTAFYVLALSENDKIHCYRGNEGCEPVALTYEAKRDTFSTIATVAGALGAVGIGAGLWLVLSPRERMVTVQGRSAPPPLRVGIAGPSVVLRGAFE